MGFSTQIFNDLNHSEFLEPIPMLSIGAATIT